MTLAPFAVKVHAKDRVVLRAEWCGDRVMFATVDPDLCPIVDEWERIGMLDRSGGVEHRVMVTDPMFISRLCDILLREGVPGVYLPPDSDSALVQHTLPRPRNHWLVFVTFVVGAAASGFVTWLLGRV